MRRLFKRAIDRVAGFYKLYQVYIYSILDKYKLGTICRISFKGRMVEHFGLHCQSWILCYNLVNYFHYERT